MDKKLKMWIAVGIVVIVVVGIIGSLWWGMMSNDDALFDPIYESEITLDISQNDTTYRILIKSVRIHYFKNDTVIEEGKLDSHPLLVKITRGNNSWTRPILYKLDELGVNYLDINENDYFDKGDMIIIDKDGGEEYSPKVGDEIQIEDDGGNYRIDSNIIKLATEL